MTDETHTSGLHRRHLVQGAAALGLAGALGAGPARAQAAHAPHGAELAATMRRPVATSIPQTS